MQILPDWFRKIAAELAGITVLDRKTYRQVPVEIGMALEFQPNLDTMKKSDYKREKLIVADISFDNYRGRHLIHFTDHTHTSHPEQMEVWYDVPLY